jgi:mannose-6-phosphate isomerase-like protein (cupin superfamily)
MRHNEPGYFLEPGQGSAVSFVMGERLCMKATSDQTGGTFALMEDLAAPGAGPPLHLHRHEDEAFYVLEGVLSMTCGERTFTASPGSFLWVPRGTPHTFRVEGDQPARFLTLYTPGGAERFFVEAGEPARAATPPPPPPRESPVPDRVVELATKYGVVVVGAGAAPSRTWSKSTQA